MSMAWLRLLQARAEKEGDDLYIRDAQGHRIRSQDGDWLCKPLKTLVEDFFPQKDPRVANLLFFITLRNKIEHRCEQDIASLVAGRTQALVLNYEQTLTELFGNDEGLSNRLRFPLFLSSITQDARDALKAVRKRIPRRTLDWLQDFDAALEPDLAAHPSFDFRIYLLPQTGPKTEADAAMTFVRMEELTDEQRATMDQVQTIIRDKQVPVSDLGALLPKQVAAKVEAAIGRPFNPSTHHARAWHHHGVRPPTGAPDPAKTKSDFCRWNPAFRQYVYTENWVNFLIRKLSDPRQARGGRGVRLDGRPHVGVIGIA